MSASTDQIAANQANSQRSTGPVTPEGKAVSSRNATRYGFLANVLPAEQQDYRELLADLVADLQPAGVVQRLLVEEIALAYIRLRRIHAAEMKSMEPRDMVSECITHDRGRHLQTFHFDGCSPSEMLRDKQAHLLLRYEASVERHIQRCLTRLKEMKGDPTWAAVRRAADREDELPDESAVEGSPAPTADLDSAPAAPGVRECEELQRHAQAKTEIGFVSQKSSFDPSRNRRRRNHDRSGTDSGSGQRSNLTGPPHSAKMSMPHPTPDTRHPTPRRSP